MSPQHWAQTQKDTKPTIITLEITNHVSSTLKWKQGKFTKTVMLNANSNIATFRLAPGFREFEVYEAVAVFTAATDSNPLIAEQVHIIDDDEIRYCKTTNPWKVRPKQHHPRTVDMDLNKHISNPSDDMNIPIVQPTKDEEVITDEALILTYHRQFEKTYHLDAFKTWKN